MPTIANYIDRSAVFEPEVILVMGEAYERALSTFATWLPESVRHASPHSSLIWLLRGSVILTSSARHVLRP
jgi:hypothetical protein